MKYAISLLMLMLVTAAYGQVSGQSGNQFFAQFKYADDYSAQDIDSMEQALKQHQDVQIVRVDRINKGVFLITKDRNSLAESTVYSWASIAGDDVQCYYQGIFQVDETIGFADDFCSKVND
ncbi:MAG: hypothetical protein ACQERC_00860 [Bacteroidota bacterium]